MIVNRLPLTNQKKKQKILYSLNSSIGIGYWVVGDTCYSSAREATVCYHYVYCETPNSKQLLYSKDNGSSWAAATLYLSDGSRFQFTDYSKWPSSSTLTRKMKLAGNNEYDESDILNERITVFKQASGSVRTRRYTTGYAAPGVASVASFSTNTTLSVEGSYGSGTSTYYLVTYDSNRCVWVKKSDTTT